MITLTWNPQHTRIGDFRAQCQQHLGEKIMHKDTDEHSICSVSELLEFKSVNAGNSTNRQTGFILKLKTKFESKYTVVKSHLVAVSEDGNLCYNTSLQEFIQLNYEVPSLNYEVQRLQPTWNNYSKPGILPMKPIFASLRSLVAGLL